MFPTIKVTAWQESVNQILAWTMAGIHRIFKPFRGTPWEFIHFDSLARSDSSTIAAPKAHWKAPGFQLRLNAVPAHPLDVACLMRLVSQLPTPEIPT